MSCCGDDGPCFSEFDQPPEQGGPGGRLLLYAIGGIVGLLLLGALMTRGRTASIVAPDAAEATAEQVDKPNEQNR
jgi:hypothetical protein